MFSLLTLQATDDFLTLQVTDDASDVTMAHFMGEVGRRVPVAARFSTVTHEKGSPESLRDVRGFSVKMYTEQGNWDFVGNNIPVSHHGSF